MNSAPEPEPPRTLPTAGRTDAASDAASANISADASDVLRPYPTAPDTTPPGPWPGLVYLGSDGPGADRSGPNGPGTGRPAIPATVLIAPATHTLDDATAGRLITTLGAIAASFAPPAATIAVLAWPDRPHPTTAPPAHGASAAATIVRAVQSDTGPPAQPTQNETAHDTATRAAVRRDRRPILLRLAPATTTSATGPTPPPRDRGPTTITATVTTATWSPGATARQPAEALADLPPTTRPGLHPPSPLDLIITAVAPDDVDEARMSAVAVAAAGALRCGGLLLVLTHSDHDREGQLVDPGGLVVSTAQNADLLYFQHIVILEALDAFTDDGREPAGARGPGDTPHRRFPPPASGRPAVHRRAHHDLYVFGQQHEHHAAVPADDPVVTSATAAALRDADADAVAVGGLVVADAVAPLTASLAVLAGAGGTDAGGTDALDRPTKADHTDPISTPGSLL